MGVYPIEQSMPLTQEPGLSYTSLSVMGGQCNLIQQDPMDRCMTYIFFPQLK